LEKYDGDKKKRGGGGGGGGGLLHHKAATFPHRERKFFSNTSTLPKSDPKINNDTLNEHLKIEWTPQKHLKAGRGVTISGNSYICNILRNKGGVFEESFHAQHISFKVEHTILYTVKDKAAARASRQPQQSGAAIVIMSMCSLVSLSADLDGRRLHGIFWGFAPTRSRYVHVPSWLQLGPLSEVGDASPRTA